ncbi:MAG: hypothetical protein AAF744_16535 [Pseudomonadota bacterium]
MVLFGLPALLIGAALFLGGAALSTFTPPADKKRRAGPARLARGALLGLGAVILLAALLTGASAYQTNALMTVLYLATGAIPAFACILLGNLIGRAG